MIHAGIVERWNRKGDYCDLMDMECNTARLAISSAIDDGVVVSDEIEQHVSVCAACRQWREGVHQLRRATLRTVLGAPSAAIAVSELQRRFTMHRWIRSALAWAGALLVAWNAVDMFSAGSGLSIHFERHQAAFDVALGLAVGPGPKRHGKDLGPG